MRKITIILIIIMIMGAFSPSISGTSAVEISCYETEGKKECDLLVNVPLRKDA